LVAETRHQESVGRGLEPLEFYKLQVQNNKIKIYGEPGLYERTEREKLFYIRK